MWIEFKQKRNTSRYGVFERPMVWIKEIYRAKPMGKKINWNPQGIHVDLKRRTENQKSRRQNLGTDLDIESIQK